MNMVWLDTELLGSPPGQCLWALAVAAAGLIILVIGQRLLLGRARAIAARTATDLDDFVIDLIERTGWPFLLAVSIYLAAQSLQLATSSALPLRTLIVVILWLLQTAWWGLATVDFLVGRAMRQRLESEPGEATTINAVKYLAKVALWTLVTLLILDNIPGIEVTALIASLGVGGIAVALAIQNILGDLFACLSIILDKPFAIGDFIIVGDLLGTVEHIGLKSTRLRSLTGEQLVFSNSDLLNSRIRNYKTDGRTAHCLPIRCDI
jgi:small-conductance mechanosensitive channel